MIGHIKKWWNQIPPMSPVEYENAIARLDMTQAGAARFLGINVRTSRHWIAGDAAVPRAVAILLRLMIARGLDGPSAARIAGEERGLHRVDEDKGG